MLFFLVSRPMQMIVSEGYISVHLSSEGNQVLCILSAARM